METVPLVSTIIATYNRKTYVCDAIDSVLRQTYPNIEVVVIDDGSTDGTGDLLNERYGNRIRYVYRQNQGRSAARNYGIQSTRGTYIAFLDSDDMWKPDKLSSQISYMEQHPEYGLTHTFINNVRGDVSRPDFAYDAKIYRQYRKAIKRGYTYKGMSRWCTMFWSTVVVRTDIAKAVGPLDSTCETYEDWDWYLRASLITRIGTLTAPLTLYRIHGENSSVEQFHAGQINLAKKHLAQLEQVPPPMRRGSESNLCLQLATVAYYQENKQECAYWMRHAVRATPVSLITPVNAPLLFTMLLPSKIALCAREFRRRFAG